MTDISYWLMKSEPAVYGLDKLQEEVTTLWDGIRNYQARNFMRLMEIGDQVFFYHSNCKPPGIVGLMEVTQTKLIDPTQFDQNSRYFDPKSSKKNPRWDCVEVKYLGRFQNQLNLEEIKKSYVNDDLPLVRKGNRLSIMPISREIAISLIQKLGNLD